ncbi:MerR family transcriptional regulator [Pedobacter immunditicola]|uniref:MerR family transcriptional regulator n=1 Tax=Pedobacter immunditicola TaxID=3133440 RepID=UPI0030ADB6F9
MQYSISDLEKLSGIQAHTIRIWEQRYNALKPSRTAGNTRYYDDNEVKRLLNIVSLSESGLKISQICALSDQELQAYIEREIVALSADNKQFEPYISQLLHHGLTYDEITINKLLSKCTDHYGLKATYQHIIYPLLVRLGLFWQKDSIYPAQEHFLSNLIRQKLYSAIDALPTPENPQSVWLLFLPEDEGHDIGLLYANYVLKEAGEKVIYLGSHVPMPSLIQAVKDNPVDHLLLFMVYARLTTDAQSYIDHLTAQFPDLQIHLSGSHKLLSDLKMPQQVNWFNDIGAFENFIHPNELTV